MQVNMSKEKFKNTILKFQTNQIKVWQKLMKLDLQMLTPKKCKIQVHTNFFTNSNRKYTYYNIKSCIRFFIVNYNTLENNICIAFSSTKFIS